jgi:hypothetical protein
MDHDTATHWNRTSAGAWVCIIGVVHTLLGIWGFAPELAAIGRDGVFATALDARAPAGAALWFLSLGFMMIALGSLMRWVEVELGGVLPLRIAVGLVAVAAFVVILDPLSGGYTLLWPALLIARRARAAQRRLFAGSELGALVDGADHIDVKTVESDVALRPFVTRLIAYQPAWVTALYWVRRAFMRLLGLRQDRMPRPPQLRPEQLPMTVGEAVGFFHVHRSVEERLWVAEADDKHLRAKLGVLVEDAGQGRKRMHVLTVVHYKNWAGPIYFNVIRPFHHLVVSAMIRAALRAGRSAVRPA